jgi:SAM-dependent methyltransferase
MKICNVCHTHFTAMDWQCPTCAYLPPSIGGFKALAPDFAKGGGGFRPEAFEKLAALEEASFWFCARNRLIVWALKKHFPDMRRFMEIGCGTGYVLSGVANAYPEATLVGSEIFSVSLPYAASRVKNAELIQMDARSIPFIDEFDVIGAFDVLEHIKEDDGVLQSMLSALRPGGGIVITVPQYPWLWSSADESACHVRRYKINELREKVIAAGFNLQFETSFVSFLLPMMIASRLTRWRSSVQDDSLAELKLSNWLNFIFKKIMNLEHKFIKNGIHLKFGGSMLLIAKKER